MLTADCVRVTGLGENGTGVTKFLGLPPEDPPELRLAPLLKTGRGTPMLPVVPTGGAFWFPENVRGPPVGLKEPRGIAFKFGAELPPLEMKTLCPVGWRDPKF